MSWQPGLWGEDALIVRGDQAASGAGAVERALGLNVLVERPYPPRRESFHAVNSFTANRPHQH